MRGLFVTGGFLRLDSNNPSPPPSTTIRSTATSQPSTTHPPKRLFILLWTAVVKLIYRCSQTNIAIFESFTSWRTIRKRERECVRPGVIVGTKPEDHTEVGRRRPAESLPDPEAGPGPVITSLLRIQLFDTCNSCPRKVADRVELWHTVGWGRSNTGCIKSYFIFLHLGKYKVKSTF